MDRDTKVFIAEYVRELRDDNAAVFIGAGLSKAAGYVDWAGLLSSVAKNLGLDARKETNLIAVAQYHVNSSGAHRSQLNKLLIREFSDFREPTDNHKLLARLPIRTFWTTNYDKLIEKALEDCGKLPDVKHREAQLSETVPGRHVTLYKMHGDISNPDQAVLTRDDYENYQDNYKLFRQALSGDLLKKTFLFLGFSFTDPNIEFVLSELRRAVKHNGRLHYVITKKRTQFPGESGKDFRYAEIKQKLIADDLLQYNFKTLYIDDFSDITSILKVIEERFRRRTVFISGRGHADGIWGRDTTEDFVHELAGALIDKNLRIATGFGYGLGNAVVAGAVEKIYADPKVSVDERLILRPYPKRINDAAKREETLKHYREDLISRAGIAIFLSGNKPPDAGENETRIEFDMAKAHGVSILPIGASGSLAFDLWREVNDDLPTFFPKRTNKLRPMIRIVGDASLNPKDILYALLRIIDILIEE